MATKGGTGKTAPPFNVNTINQENLKKVKSIDKLKLLIINVQGIKSKDKQAELTKILILFSERNHI